LRGCKKGKGEMAKEGVTDVDIVQETAGNKHPLTEVKITSHKTKHRFGKKSLLRAG